MLPNFCGTQLTNFILSILVTKYCGKVKNFVDLLNRYLQKI